MLSMTPWLLLLAVLAASIHCHPIAPGNYSQDRVLDYFHLSISKDAKVRIKYHDHPLKSEDCKFLSSGGLLQFELKRDDQGRLRGAHHAGTPSVFKAINETHLLEASGNKELLWRRTSADEMKSQLVEVAMIQNPNNRSDAFIREAFSPSRTPPVYYWSGVYGVSACPTVEIYGIDERHTASKLIGITMAHFRVWQDFYWRHKSDDRGQRILILESDIHCSREFCGDIAIEHINRTDKDMLYVGFCVWNNEPLPPYCSHAYAISVRAAKILSNFVSFCRAPVDVMMTEVLYSNDLTWAIVDTGKNLDLSHTDGLIVQNDW